MITVELDGVRFQCSDEGALRAVLKAVRPDLLRPALAADAPSSPNGQATPPPSPEPLEKLERPVHALQIIVSAGARGVQGSDLASHLGLSSARGLGPVMAALKSRAAAMDLNPVVRQAPDGRWTPTQNSLAALDRLKGGAS